LQGTSSGTSSSVSNAARSYTLGVLTFVYMFNFVDRQLPAILLPAIRAEFQVSDTLLGLLVGTAFALFYSVLGVPIALLADRWNRRNLITLALAIWSGMTALSGLAANFWHLALARIGVGIGEAGCSPPAHSMIADLYPPERRSTAMGVYTMGISAGIMLAYIGGGWVVENIGWREAFFIVGIPGLVLALVVRLTVAEPPRGHSEARTDHGQHPPIRDVFGLLFSRKSFLNMAVGAGLSSFAGYAAISWFPSFLARSFEGSFVLLNVWLGLILGIAGGLGFLGGGALADFFGRIRQRNAMWFIAATQFAAAIASFGVYLAGSAKLALLMFILPVFISNFYLAPVLAQTQSLVPLRMRGVASASVLLIINLIGLAMGPPVVGILSDYLAPSFGDDSLRYALLIAVSVVTPWAALHYYLASRSIESDLAKARES
jgi:predicted MFS family arabinose efflux permease